MNTTELLLKSFDSALTHEWESFDMALRGVNEEAAVWQHVAYSREPHDAGVGRPGSILWYLNHLEHCHRHYTAVLRARPIKASPDTKPPGELSLKAILPALHKANADLRAEIAKLKDSDLDAPCTSTKNVCEFLLGVVRHISWHSGQIAVAKRLHRTR